MTTDAGLFWCELFVFALFKIYTKTLLTP